MKPRSFQGSPFLKAQTRKSFRKEARAALRLAYGKAERGIDKEIKGSRLAQKRTRGYFNEYKGAVDSAAERTAGAYGQAGDSIQKNSMNSANFAETLRQRMASEAQADAARRGVPYDASGSQVATQANLSRVDSANTLSGVTAAQGASQAGMYADKGRIASRESVEQQLREQARRRALQGEKREMAGDKAAQVSQMLGTARDQDRDFYLGLMAAREPGKDRRAARKESAKGRKFDRRQSAKDRALTRSENAKDRRAGGKGDKRERRQERREDVRNIIANLEGFKPRDARKAYQNRRWAISEILRNEGEGVSPKDARRAYKRWRNRSDWANLF